MKGIDYRQLYFDLISDFDPYADMAEHENLDDSEMLYNLLEIRNSDGFDDIDDYTLIDRFDEVIKLFKAIGINPYYD